MTVKPVVYVWLTLTYTLTYRPGIPMGNKSDHRRVCLSSINYIRYYIILYKLLYCYYTILYI